MSQSFKLDLDDFDVEPLHAGDSPAGISLESLTRGHGMSEVAASVVGACPILLCSCCCCC
ncbi:hypothetical protein HNP84_003364 [Thermocatellispora tengchongensis]|uniref:GE37468 family thiazolyl peptide n=1 Tax=Thermocatellispora tengchongensis TaxID=1073253 RepID=A0A840P1R7_9ACTN|nr:thiomuracin/GE37468 family thiazolyl RiPP peptide [Thermocatellispora tengchongensis]MBB5133638.1 hypothetical protein [Thermocatellispora tengchongensis]